VILYNGASGGLGQHLAARLADLDEPSHALSARLEDQSGLEAELARLELPDGVTFIHLAARVSVPACEADPSAAYNLNVALAESTVGTVIDWASRHGARARVIYVSSGHVYAAPPEGSRVSEDAPTLPRSVYAQTKLAAERTLQSMASSHGVPFVAARVFGLLAPRQAANYVLPALIERARRRDVNGVPGLDFARDYLDARDVCEDLLLITSVPWPEAWSVVNICSGVPVRIRELLRAALLEFNPMGADDIARDAAPAPGRPDDIQWLVGDPSRFVGLTGVSPQRIPLSRTVADAVAAANEAPNAFA
jgi:UDP-glucose 4-epimerase